MENNTIIEGNKLIAKFMDIKTVNNTCELCGKDVTVKWFCKGNIDGFTRSHALGGLIIPLRYHSSWNWLMLVVEKIEALGEWQIEIELFSCYIINSNNILSETPCIVIESHDDSKIKAVYTAVIEFIKSYNRNRQPEQHENDVRLDNARQEK